MFASVQRGYAERYGWLLQLNADAGACAIDLDTGTAPRRLRVGIERKDDGWHLATNGALRLIASAADTVSVTADFDAPTRTIHWWTSAGTTWETPFDALPSAGEGPYGLWLRGRLLPTRAGRSRGRCDAPRWRRCERSGRLNAGLGCGLGLVGLQLAA